MIDKYQSCKEKKESIMTKNEKIEYSSWDVPLDDISSLNEPMVNLASISNGTTYDLNNIFKLTVEQECKYTKYKTDSASYDFKAFIKKYNLGLTNLRKRFSFWEYRFMNIKIEDRLYNTAVCEFNYWVRKRSYSFSDTLVNGFTFIPDHISNSLSVETSLDLDEELDEENSRMFLPKVVSLFVQGGEMAKEENDLREEKLEKLLDGVKI